MQNSLFQFVRQSLGWLLLVVFSILLLSSTGAQLHSRLLLMGDWLYGDYYMLRADLPAPSCQREFDIEKRLDELESAASADAGLDALFDDDASFDREASRRSLEKAQQLCQDKYDLYEESSSQITTSVKMFRSIEQAVEFFSLIVFDYQKFLIVLVLFLGAICATLSQHHISFRPIKTRFEHYCVQSLETLALLGLYIPSLTFFAQSKNAITSPLSVIFAWTVVGAASVLAVFSLVRLLKPLDTLQNDHRSLLAKSISTLLCIPIYIYMLLIAGFYFLVVEKHVTGISIYAGQLFEQAEMFLQIGLYIWLGMLLKRSRLGQQFFDVIRPWGFSPEIVAFIAVVLMAVPTAYTGASGIIIIAMGAIVYTELCRSGSRRSLALAATAMTGSAGVVLRPCLIIVVIAALNKDVVTQDLYSSGLRVFGLSMALLLLVLLMTSKDKFTVRPWAQVKTPFVQALQQLVTPVVLFVIIMMAYDFILDAQLDEISAPIILPVIMLVILIFERRNGIKKQVSDEVNDQIESTGTEESLLKLVHAATMEAALHIGALLMLMTFSFALGGVIERTEVVALLPSVFESIWVCMAMLVVILVLIGMVMDPFGAVVLVSGSLASLAYTNGIAPLHFWMVTLVAFELGYLTPPVALNHLLTRQVIGEKEAVLAEQEAMQASGWWYKHERILLPMTVMAITLLLTAFVPLFVKTL